MSDNIRAKIQELENEVPGSSLNSKTACRLCSHHAAGIASHTYTLVCGGHHNSEGEPSVEQASFSVLYLLPGVREPRLTRLVSVRLFSRVPSSAFSSPTIDYLVRVATAVTTQRSLLFQYAFVAFLLARSVVVMMVRGFA